MAATDVATTAEVPRKEPLTVIDLDSDSEDVQPHTNCIKREDVSHTPNMGQQSQQSNDDWESASVYEDIYEEIDPDDYEPGKC